MLKRIAIGFLLCLNFTAIFADEIKLTVENLNNGSANLAWTSCGTGSVYKVLRRFDATMPWDSIATLIELSYIDTVGCSKEISYKIAVLDGGCPESNIETKYIADLERPANVRIDAVSVNPQTNEMQIFWTPCISPDTYGYIVYEARDQGGSIKLDTLYGAEQNQYTVKKALDTSIRFQIRAFDSCENASLMSDEKQAYACRLDYQQCEKKIQVFWSNPQKSMDHIAYFDIMLSKNDNVFLPVIRVDSLKSSAIIDVSERFAKYKIYVRASNSDSTIFTNSVIDTIFVAAAPQPNITYLETLNVLDNSTLEMHCRVDVSVIWQNLSVYISDTLVETITYDDFLQNKVILLPYQNTEYYFEISDTCGETATVSNKAKPIRLEATLDGNFLDITYSQYQGWQERDSIYLLMAIENNDTVIKGQYIPCDGAICTDQLFLQNPDQIYSLSYYVLAYENSENPYKIKAVTKSNTVELIRQQKIPVGFSTGFMPEGKSKLYYPIYVPHPDDRMKFQIVNKFGQIVFSTDKPRDGWDGTFNGQAQRGGIYLYQFTLTRNGFTMQENGCFVLIR